jgi:diaminopimelate decarboxylase|tara:strand:+ start:164 stop:379 length:216 start_codon:yes stop_codon:yes gene_type:complete
MIAPTNLFELQKLKKEYNKLSSFIRSLDVHFAFNANMNLAKLLTELALMQKRIDQIIIEMDAFEQNELGMK